MSKINVKRVAVIGAGPAGAIAVDALAQENAFDKIRVFERREKAGGLWIYDPELEPQVPSFADIIKRSADNGIAVPTTFPARTAKDPLNSLENRYSYTPQNEHLESNIDARVMSFTQEPFPSQLSALSVRQYGPNSPFRHREVVREWIQGLFNRNGYERLVEYNTTVERAEKIGQDWVLTLRRSTQDEGEDIWWQETFDAVIVANGHYSIPFVPEVPGLAEAEARFPGTVEHSKTYRGPQKYAGKKVVVVGASVSATDIARDLIKTVESPVYASLRGPHPVFGYAAFEHPKIHLKPGIAKVDSSSGSKTVTFSDGSTLRDVDNIIFGTGYLFSIPFLPSVKVVDRRLDGFYQHVWKQDDPTLAIVGGVSGGFTFRVFEYQAVAAARVLSGRGKLPPLEDQQRWEEERQAKHGNGVPFYKIAPDFKEYFTALKDIADSPEEGKPGRKLLDFDPAWLEIFLGGVQTRLELWKRERESAEKEIAKLAGPVRAKL